MNAADLRERLRSYLKPAEWALFFEVPNGTGGNIRRYADAVAMNLWPSRGHSLVGYEIKVSSSDLNRELEDPAKADAIGRYCDTWFLITPPGLIDKAKWPWPPNWGLLEATGPTLRLRRQATPNAEPKSLSRPFVAALLRRAGESDASRIEAGVRARAAEQGRLNAEWRQRELKQLQADHGRAVARLKALEAAGMPPDWQPAPAVGAAVKLVVDLGLTETYGRMQGLRRSLKAAKDIIDKATEEWNGNEKQAGRV